MKLPIIYQHVWSIMAQLKEKSLLQQIGYPKGVGSKSGSFLDSVYNFANAILAESNSPQHLQFKLKQFLLIRKFLNHQMIYRLPINL